MGHASFSRFTLSRSTRKEHHGFGAHGSVLGSAEGKRVHAQVTSGLTQVQSLGRRGVGDPCAVHVKKHIVIMGKTRQLANFVRLINGADLSSLSH